MGFNIVKQFPLCIYQHCHIKKYLHKSLRSTYFQTISHTQKLSTPGKSGKTRRGMLVPFSLTPSKYLWTCFSYIHSETPALNPFTAVIANHSALRAMWQTTGSTAHNNKNKTVFFFLNQDTRRTRYQLQIKKLPLKLSFDWQRFHLIGMSVLSRLFFHLGLYGIVGHLKCTKTWINESHD